MLKQTSCKVLMYLLCAVVLAGGVSGCKGKKNQDFPPIEPTNNTGNLNETTTGDGLPNVDLGSLLFDPSSDSGLKPIYFDFDSSSLRPDALATLRDNAAKIKQVPGVIIQVAGHCDERGTQEYNLALGERRALAIREHLIQLGVSGDRMVTISYGEEMPAVSGSNESAWSMNRRAEFLKAQSL